MCLSGKKTLNLECSVTFKQYVIMRLNIDIKASGKMTNIEKVAASLGKQWLWSDSNLNKTYDQIGAFA